MCTCPSVSIVIIIPHFSHQIIYWFGFCLNPQTNLSIDWTVCMTMVPSIFEENVNDPIPKEIRIEIGGKQCCEGFPNTTTVKWENP